MSASITTLILLDSILSKAVKIISVNDHQEILDLRLPSLNYQCQMAAITVLSKMHTSLCLPKVMLPQPYMVRKTTHLHQSV